jgi:hypothetical protein
MIKKEKSVSVIIIMFTFLLFLGLPGHIWGAGNSVEERFKALEERIKSLEETNKTLEMKATRAQDVIDIQNLQARYCAIHNTQESLGWMLFANRPDTTQEITHSRFVGFDNIKKNYLEGPAAVLASGNLPEGTVIGWTGFASSGAASGNPAVGAPGGSSKSGIHFIHPISTPCIVVADDGKTAKATFTSLGFEGGWCYGMYANDYIKIDGKWYIWHMKWLRCFKTTFYKSWDDQTVDEIYEFTQGKKDEWGFPKVDSRIDYSYLNAPGKVVKTITAPQPYKTWTKEDENGAWWKRETVTP